MRYLVPHFLETEQKIWGPFTFANFIILIGVGGLAFVLFFLLDFVLWLLIAIALGVITIALMFYRPYGRPLWETAINFFYHLIGSRQYTWSGSKQTQSPSEFLVKTSVPKEIPKQTEQEEKLSAEKLEKISNMLDK